MKRRPDPDIVYDGKIPQEKAQVFATLAQSVHDKVHDEIELKKARDPAEYLRLYGRGHGH